jgi:transcriptional regulator GlxA family with amidase domain
VSNMLTVSIVVPPEANPSVAVGFYEAFWSAGVLWNRVMGEPERPSFKPELVGASLDAIVTTAGIRIVPERRWGDGAAGDIVVVPSLYVSPGSNFGGHNLEILDWLRRAHSAGKPIFSTCTGAFLLAEADLLNDCDATTHWAYIDVLRTKYPRIRVHSNRVLVAANPDQSIVTCGGGASWMDMALYLIGRYANRESAMQYAKIQMYDWHHEGQTPYSRLQTKGQTGDRLVHDCQEWLANHYADSDPVQEMVRRSGLSRGSFVRRFQTATGHAPLDYVQRIRIEEAKQLLETNLNTIEKIGADVGYIDNVSFRRLFKRVVGETPSAYRRRQSTSAAVRTLKIRTLDADQP